MSEVPSGEMERRHACGERFETAQKLNALQERLKGIRIGINVLIEDEKRTQIAIKELMPIGQQDGGRSEP
jgi:hypothetical protein